MAARHRAMCDAATELEEARLLGRERGFKEGREEGRLLALRETVQKLVDSGMALDEALRMTGLRPEELGGGATSE
ncbi:MAG: hypothetical protein AB7S38_26110 [Vulcanimicrobiota bacterium]